jgi:hypothetical protein
MDSWLIKQSKSVERNIDILGASSSTKDGSPAERKKAEKILNGLPDIRFYQLVNGEERPRCIMCGEVLANNSFNARNLREHLTTKHESLANKPLKYFESKVLEIRKQSNCSHYFDKSTSSLL